MVLNKVVPNAEKGRLMCVIISILAGLMILPVESVFSQSKSYRSDNPIVFAMPALAVSPDARASGMGDIGVATSPSVDAQHWNVSKYVFNETKTGVSLSYIPWLRRLGTSNVNLLYLTGYHQLDGKQAIGASLRYFSLGEVTFLDDMKNFIRSSNPNEMAIDISYSRLLGDFFSIGAAFRYLRSDIVGGYFTDNNTATISPANSWAADVGFYYYNPMHIGPRTGVLSAGLSISNIGSKMAYGQSEDLDKSYFLPTTLRLGVNLDLDLDYYNQMSYGLEVSKYLVPILLTDEDEKMTVPAGIMRSFHDAPGGFREELEEIMLGAGVEYVYSRMFKVRTGYYNDFKNYSRRYATLGVGFVYYMYSLDVSYLFPVISGLQNPLAHTVHVSLAIDFGKSLRRRRFANNF